MTLSDSGLLTGFQLLPVCPKSFCVMPIWTYGAANQALRKYSQNPHETFFRPCPHSPDGLNECDWIPTINLGLLHWFTNVIKILPTANNIRPWMMFLKNELWTVFIQLDHWLRWRYTVEWAIASESVSREPCGVAPFIITFIKTIILKNHSLCWWFT